MTLDDRRVRCVGIKRGADYPANSRAWRYQWERCICGDWEPWSEDYFLSRCLLAQVVLFEDALVGREFCAHWHAPLGKFHIESLDGAVSEGSGNHWEHDRPHENVSDPLKTAKFYA